MYGDEYSVEMNCISLTVDASEVVFSGLNVTELQKRYQLGGYFLMYVSTCVCSVEMTLH